MLKPKPLIAAVLALGIAILIGVALFRPGPRSQAAPPSPAATAEPDSGLSRAMTFTTPAEPKK